MPSWLIAILSLIGGGLSGAIFKTFYDRRQARARPIPLVELVNINPLSQSVEGVKLVRVDAGTDVTHLRHYELLLRNTSGSLPVTCSQTPIPMRRPAADKPVVTRSRKRITPTIAPTNGATEK